MGNGDTVQAYVGLGGNLETTLAAFQKVRAIWDQDPKIYALQVSDVYQTTPVLPISEGPYLNGVASLKTSYGIKELFLRLKSLEKELGRVGDPDAQRRVIDLDLLFYGVESFHDHELTVPHPRWRERLFVLRPLADLTEDVILSDEKVNLEKELAGFKNPHEELVCKLF